MGQRVFQVAKSLGVASKDIIRKLIAEELPPPADRSKSDRDNEWTPRSQVSVGLAEMIREWHAAGELKVLPVATTDASPETTRRASRKRSGTQTSANLDASVPSSSSEAPSSDLARQVLDSVAQIEQEAQQKKRDQADGLRQSRRAILDQIRDFRRQADQIDHALAAISGTSSLAKAKGTRRDLNDVRERMGRWLEAHRGEKFNAGILTHEFPELQGTAVSYVLKPLVAVGRVQADASEGVKRPKYFAPPNNETAITS